MNPLEGRVAIVTGAARGIGRGIADSLAGHGMLVAACDLQPPETGALRLSCDVTSKPQIDAMFDRVEAELGPLWLLVNNAGVYHAAPAVDLAEQDWDRVFAVDTKGAFLCSQAALRRMAPRKAGRIVNIASIAGLIVRTNQLSYCAAKAATIHLSHCLAVEVAPLGITVNCLCPGMTETEMLRESRALSGASLEQYESLVPSGRLATPEDHASLVRYFALPESQHITGQVVCVDGGQSQNLPITAATPRRS
jgi:meso-butanediol dehydrogenase/(S,S)-butanediol dehydrogenase/diacetyl reductase